MNRSSSTECLNCGTALTGAYCSTCGQKAGRPVLTMRDILRETSHELFDWDGKIPSTLWTLFTKPGRLTIDVLEGRRARWLTPLRVYLICSIVFFAAKPVLEAVTGRSPRANIRLETDLQPGRPLTPEQRATMTDGLPARILGAERIERAFTRGTDFSREAESSFPVAMFVLLPVFAFLTWIVWRTRRREYAAHVITALHIHAMGFGSSVAYWTVATVAPWPVVGAIGTLLLVTYWAWYGLTTFHRVYGDSRIMTAVKALAVMVPYAVLVFAAGLAIMALVVFQS
jgi:hypothetical protein